MLGLIDKARVGSIIDSAYGYLSSVEKFYIGSFSDDSEFELDGSYVIEDGKLGDYDIAFSGNVPIAGRLTYKNNDFVNGIIQYDDYYVLMYGDMLKVIGVPKNNSDGLYASSLEMDKGRYLYRGGNPNNYIWLDENGDGKRVDSELYRIISYEVDGTIKVLRNNSIEWMSFDVSDGDNVRNNSDNSFCNYNGLFEGCNLWGTSYNTTYKNEFLNDKFYYEYFRVDDVPFRSSDGSVGMQSSLNEYLNDDWLINDVSSIDKYIVYHSFAVGPYYNSGGLTYLTEKNEINSYLWIGKIGLINLSEYKEASLNNSCTSIYSGFSSSNKSCSMVNWMHKALEWVINPHATNKRSVYIINGTGYFGFHTVTNKNGVRPSFFLRSDLMFDGEGTSKNPYVIKNV